VVDVLSFVDVAYESPGRTPAAHNLRQLSVNGMTLGTHLSAAYRQPEPASSPLVDGDDDNQRFLQGLLGEPGPDALRAGRIALGYCDQCLDSSCGILAAGTLSLSETEVTWRDIGFEQEHFGELVPRFRGIFGLVGARSVPPAEWWTPNPVDPPLAFTFERRAYFATIDAERARNSAGR
jgi:hypothetical protein